MPPLLRSLGLCSSVYLSLLLLSVAGTSRACGFHVFPLHLVLASSLLVFHHPSSSPSSLAITLSYRSGKLTHRAPQRGKKRANTQNSPIISTIGSTTTASTSNDVSDVNALFLTSWAFSEARFQITARFDDSDPFVDQTAGPSNSNSNSSSNSTTTASSVVDDTDSTKVIPPNSNSVTEAGDTDFVRGRGGSNDGHDSRRSPLDSYHMDDDLMGVGGDPYSHPAEFRTESSDEDEGIDVRSVVDEPGPRESSSPEEDRDLDDSIPLNNLTVDEEEEEEEEEEDDEDAAGTGAWHEVLVMPSVEMDEMGVYEEDEDDDDEYCADCERERQEQEEEDGDNGYYTVRSFPARRYDEDEDGYYDNGRAGANGSGASGPHNNNNNNHDMGGYYDDDDDDDFSSHYGGHGGGNTRDNHHGDTSNFTAQYGRSRGHAASLALQDTRSPLLMGEYPHHLPSPSAAATIPVLGTGTTGALNTFVRRMSAASCSTPPSSHATPIRVTMQ